MPKHSKARQTLSEVLDSCSDVLFPVEIDGYPIDINSTGVDGDTPLHVLLWQDNSYGIELLIQSGANINAVGDMSETPLHVAVSQGNGLAIELLLKSGANADAISEFGESPRSMAKKSGRHLSKYFDGH